MAQTTPGRRPDQDLLGYDPDREPNSSLGAPSPQAEQASSKVKAEGDREDERAEQTGGSPAATRRRDTEDTRGL